MNFSRSFFNQSVKLRQIAIDQVVGSKLGGRGEAHWGTKIGGRDITLFKKKRREIKVKRKGKKGERKIKTK